MVVGTSHRGENTQLANEATGGRRALSWRRPYHKHLVYNGVVTLIWLGRIVWRHGPIVCLGSALLLSVTYFSILCGSVQYGLDMTLALMLPWVTLLLVHWHLWPEHFEQRVGRHVRSRWRYATVYAWKWRGTMIGAKLRVVDSGVETIPDLRHVISSRFIDRLEVKPPHGTPLKPWNDAAEGIARTFKAQRLRVRESNGRIVLDVYRKDALRAIVKPLVPEAKPNLAALPIGLTEFGEPLRLPLCGSSFAHVLVLGVTGSGKGSIYHSVFRALGPGIRDGSIRLCGIDTKGGMEYSNCRELFYKVATNVDDALRLLKWYEAKLTERATQYGGDKIRLHVASPQTPSYVLAIDEVLHPLTHAPKPIPQEFDNALRVVLQQGRAPGFSVLAAAQDPRVDGLKCRDLFSTTIALRFNTEAQTRMALGQDALDAGAECHKILAEPEGIEAGIGYAIRQGSVVRFRGSWFDDDAIAETCRLYPKPQLLAVAA